MLNNNQPSKQFNLSPEKLELLKYFMEDENIEFTATATIPPRNNQQHAPLSFAQERLWFLEQFNPNTALYNQFYALHLDGSLDIAALEKSLGTIIQRHEILRTIITTIDGHPVQIITSAKPFTLVTEDMQGQPEQAIRQKAIQEARQPFDLTQGPLLRITLLRLHKTKHLLLLTAHHIVFDGWSIGVFINEFKYLYEEFVYGQGKPLPPLPIQYADVATWQREKLQGEILDAQMAYWKQKLGNNPPSLEIPTDHPRLATQTFQGAMQFATLPKKLTMRLKELSQQEEVTLFMTLLAAFQVLLARYAEQEAVIVGTRSAGRDRTETEGLIGCFLNALVMHIDLRGNPTFREILGRVREMAMGAFSHQDLPFEKLVEGLQIKRDLNRQPLFQVMFVLQTASKPNLELPNLTISSMEVEREMARYDLDLSITEENDGQLYCSMTYNTHLFESITIQRLLAHFQSVLEAICTNPEQHFWQLPLLTQIEIQQIDAWNATASDYPHNKCLHALFEAKAFQLPDAVAVVYDENVLTYLELNTRANQLAHYLQLLAVGPKIMVGVCMERSLQTIISLLAILKAGGIYIPLDPTYPSAHLSFILSHTELPLIITEQKHKSALPSSQARIIDIETEWEQITCQDKNNCINGVTVDDTAYIMFTSGSTGRPKGVMVPQRQVLNRFAWMWNTYPFQEGEMAGQRTTSNFTPSIWELLGPLMQGVPIVILSNTIVKDPLLFVQALAMYRITRIVIVPSLLQKMLNRRDPDLRNHLSHLRLWSIGGEPLTIKLAQSFHEQLPHATLINQYGATEMSDVAYCEHWSAYSDRLNVPAGFPISNTCVYLLDRAFNLMPVGMPGEIYVASVGLPGGYWKQPDLTAECFIPDPFSNVPGNRLYNMGDVARYLPDGALEYLGRRDHQVKIRGFRVEMAGIEATLNEHPAVQQSVVIARTTELTPDDKQLVAYVMTPDVEVLSPTRLREFLKERLPDYMIPADFVVLTSLPKTPNEKIDRQALITMQVTSDKQEVGYIAPQTRIEHIIANIWQEVLQKEEVGVHSNFFDLGGHSLLSIEVRDKLQAAFSKEITLIDLFEHPTISDLARYLGEQKEEHITLDAIKEEAETQQRSRKRRRDIKKQNG